MTKYHIFIINLDRSKDRWEYYKGIKEVKRHRAIDGKKDKISKKYLDKMISLPSIKPQNHKTKVACFLSHYTLLKHIVDNKINNAIICEDDTFIDIKKINKLKLPQDNIVYLGGWLQSLLVKNNSKFNHKKWTRTFKKGLNKINKDKYRIIGAYGYYIPTWKLAKELYDNITEQKRWRHFDILLFRFEKTKSFIYPALIYANENALDSILGHTDIKYKQREYFKYY